MNLITRGNVRIAFAVLLVLSGGQLLSNVVVSADGGSATLEVGEGVAGPREDVTVVTQHAAADNAILAIGPSGNVIYRNDSHHAYFDVDPVPGTQRTVVYTAVDRVKNPNRCVEQPCARQYIEQVNLSTGETQVLYSRITPNLYASEWHDADRLNDTHYVVAGMARDRVFVVNISSGVVTWQWSVQSAYPLSGGGPYPRDWVHLNDVEQLSDGRYMVSLRNFDQVVFLYPNGTIDKSWTLGREDAHNILFEQHNPDYIPVEYGGPAVLVSDSENNRIIEYQRNSSGSWEETWVWQDDRLQWPRDADRLPNGHTLITDTHGERVIEVNQLGDITWTVEVVGPYEAERLSTGDESTGGSSAERAKLSSQTVDSESSSVSIRSRIKQPFPNKLVNGVTSVLPSWMGLFDLLANLLFLGVSSLWSVLEFYWSDYQLQGPVTK